MFLIMLWSLIALRPLLQCMTCVATHVHVRDHTPRGWSRPVVVGYQSSPVIWCVGGLVTVHGRTASCWCGSHYSRQRLHPQCWAFDGQFTRCGTEDCVGHCVNERRCQVIVTCWRSWDGSELSDDIYHARSCQLANADQYCNGNHQFWRHR